MGTADLALFVYTRDSPGWLEAGLASSGHRLLLLSILALGCKDDSGGNAPLEGVSGAPYGNFDPDHIVQVDFSMEESDWDAMRFENQNFVTALNCDVMDGPIGMDYTEFEADITMDGESISPIRIRKKGLIGSQDTTRPSFSINLDEYVDGAELFGTDNLVLNNGTQDPSLIRQCMTYGLFIDAGLPAPRCNYARVSMNDEDLGIYVHVEPVKKSFLRDHFGNDEGDLYEGTLSDFGEDWINTFDPDTDETDEDMAGLVALYEALDSDEPLLDALAPHLDIDQFLSFWAMEAITGHWDGYTGNRNNYFVYDNPETDTFAFIPWGADAALVSFEDEEGNGWVPASSILAVHFLNDDDASEMFEARVLELLDEVWLEDEIHDEIDRMEDLLATEIEIDDELESGIDDVHDYVDDRREALEDALPGNPDELGDRYCLGVMGAVSGSFETTWGSSETSPDWTEEGTAELLVDWKGYPLEGTQVGAVAGESEGYGQLALMGVLDEEEGSYLLPYMWFDPGRLVEGKAMDFDQALLGGNLYYTDASLDYGWVQAAYMGGGIIEFSTLEMEAGGTVSGVIESYLYNWQEL
jgi:spore coat protein H